MNDVANPWSETPLDGVIRVNISIGCPILSKRLLLCSQHSPVAVKDITNQGRDLVASDCLSGWKEFQIASDILVATVSQPSLRV